MADPNFPFHPAHTTPAIPDEQTTDAIRRVITDWDGKNWEAVRAVLREHRRTPDEIEKMSLMAIRMAFAVGQRPMTVTLGGTLTTATHSVAKIELPGDGDGQSGEKPGSVVVGAGVSWERAKELAEDHCKRNPFPGVKTLARLIKCSPSTMSKAIDRSPSLKARQAEMENGARSVQAKQGIPESYVNPKAVDPVERASENEQSTDDAFQRLLQQAKPAERAKLNAMTAEQKRELVVTLAHDDAADPSYRRR